MSAACAADRFDSNHSEDIVQVFHGRGEPTYLCGWHASQSQLRDTLRALSRRAPRMVQDSLFAGESA